jgi:magnesium transporter
MTTINIIEYNEQEYKEYHLEDVSQIKNKSDTNLNRWIDIETIAEPKPIEFLASTFNFHPLLIEDIVSSTHRPKLDDYEDYIFIVAKMLTYDSINRKIKTEQIRFILGEDYLITIQEKEGDVFDKIRDKLKGNKGKIRKQKPDYLLYSLLDSIVDNYFTIIETIGEDVERIESHLISDNSTNSLRNIYKIKRELIQIRKAVWPIREVISKLERVENNLIHSTTLLYVRDIYDHCVQIIETVESHREVVSSLLDIYLSSTSNKLNAVMKVLTIISTIFMPLSFIVGLYGMNFKYMPELDWHYGYFTVIGTCLTISIVMLIYFKKKKWL